MKVVLSICILFLLFPACAEKKKETLSDQQKKSFTLQDFYTENALLDAAVEQIFQSLDTKARAGQMIVAAAGRLGKPDPEVEHLLKNNMLGGVLLLNGTVEGFKEKVANFNNINKSAGGLPLIYSADAEPSLIKRKIEGSTPVPNTVDIKSDAESGEVALTISKDLMDIGIRHNFAPVIDLSASNQAITNRSYGSNIDEVVAKADAFIQASQDAGIVATAKHFPGHGLVKGDTHHQLVYIDGALQELDTYKPIIAGGVLSIMVAHIAIENNHQYNTHGRPSSCSRLIVTDLLRNKLGFNGLIVTDAMNMGALSSLENATLEAVKAGCDIILMPIDEPGLINDIMELYQRDLAMKDQIDRSVKRIIRMKYCLGLF